MSILPQRYFASRIAGDLAEFTVLAGQGQNPHNYEATPRQIQALSTAAAWILSGTEFEIGLKPKVEELFPELEIIDGFEGLNYRLLEDHGHEEEGHSGSDHLENSEIDRHAWLGLEGAKLMADHITRFLCRIDEANASVYRKNHDELVLDMEAEFGKLREELRPLNGQTVFVYHPSFGYFFDEFGIAQEAVESGGKEPSPRQLAALIEQARREKVSVIFVQAQFPAAAAETAANAIGAELAAVDPLAEDWLSNIRLMGETLKKAARSSGAESEKID